MREVQSERDVDKLRRRAERKSRGFAGPHTRSYAVTSQHWTHCGVQEGRGSSLLVDDETKVKVSTSDSEETDREDSESESESVQQFRFPNTNPADELQPIEAVPDDSQSEKAPKSKRLVLKDRKAIARQRQGKLPLKKPATALEKKESLRAFDFSRESTLRAVGPAGGRSTANASPKKRSSESRRLSQSRKQKHLNEVRPAKTSVGGASRGVNACVSVFAVLSSSLRRLTNLKPRF